jgi:DNA-binding XRE family transcriptional regulator
MKNSIKTICQTKEIPISHLAKKAHISRMHLYDIMNGKAEPTGPVMFKIANVLDEPLNSIFFDNPVSYSEQKQPKSRIIA